MIKDMKNWRKGAMESFTSLVCIAEVVLLIADSRETTNVPPKGRPPGYLNGKTH